jgi:hypothetical protein
MIGTWTVEVVHGDLADEAEAAALRLLTVEAWAKGCHRVDGTNDTTRFRMSSQVEALAVLAIADSVALSFWRVSVR